MKRSLYLTLIFLLERGREGQVFTFSIIRSNFNNKSRKGPVSVFIFLYNKLGEALQHCVECSINRLEA